MLSKSFCRSKALRMIRLHAIPCRSRLAGDGVCEIAIASKPAPTDRGMFRIDVSRASGVCGLEAEPSNHRVQVHCQSRQLVARRAGLIGAGGGLHRQITNVHQIAIHFTGNLCLLFGSAGDHQVAFVDFDDGAINSCLLYTSPSPRDLSTSRMPSSA